MIIGYARTSTTDRIAGLAAQQRDLTAAGAETIYAEQIASTAERAQLQACLAFARKRDAVMVTRPDRQGQRMRPRMFSSHVGCDRAKRNEPRLLLLWRPKAGLIGE